LRYSATISIVVVWSKVVFVRHRCIVRDGSVPFRFSRYSKNNKYVNVIFVIILCMHACISLCLCFVIVIVTAAIIIIF